MCLDLESHLISWFSGEGQLTPLNSNAGVSGADYFERERYRKQFDDVFEALRREGLFTHDLGWIRNQDLFKLSPFKALTDDQSVAVLDILNGLFGHLERGSDSTSVIEGGPGTGKTIVAVFLMKLLADIKASRQDDEIDSNSPFADFFLEGYREMASTLRMALVVPQQSLRTSVQRVFCKTPGLTKRMVLTPFEVGKSAERFDLLVVDEAHRLGQRAAQAFPSLTKEFGEINRRLFGEDDLAVTQLDWILAQSDHRILLVDAAQSIRPSDLPGVVLDELVAAAKRSHSWYRLKTQMRVRAGEDYIGYARGIVSDSPPAARRTFGDYELALYEDFGAMQDAIAAKDDAEGLARCVAGYAWEWRTRRGTADHDIELDGRRVAWNRADRDWINSEGSLWEMGSIHTVQGYDLNYCGVVIGPRVAPGERTASLHSFAVSGPAREGRQRDPRHQILGRRSVDVRSQHLWRAADARHPGYLRLRLRSRPPRAVPALHACPVAAATAARRWCVADLQGNSGRGKLPRLDSNQ